ncbi:MAG TPA: hypothetical protein EYP14_18435, partial [Planctomycetaceae bacterium]|nr:hypothetical protein [Planctomycetaceae bacterium]
MARSDDIFDENDRNEDAFSDDSLFDESFQPDDLSVETGESEEPEVLEEVSPDAGAADREPEGEGIGGAPDELPEERRAEPEKKRPEVLWPYGTKRNLFLTSLVAALPAAVLAFLMIKAFLSYTEKMNVKLMTLAGITLLTSAVVALTPAAILVFAPKEAEKPATETAE